LNSEFRNEPRKRAEDIHESGDMTEPSVKVNIYGTEYRVNGEADDQYIHRIAAYVDQTMRDISRMGRHISPTRIAVLAAFNIADELHQLRGEGPDDEKVAETEAKADRLLKLFEDLED